MAIRISRLAGLWQPLLAGMVRLIIRRARFPLVQMVQLTIRRARRLQHAGTEQPTIRRVRSRLVQMARQIIRPAHRSILARTALPIRQLAQRLRAQQLKISVNTMPWIPMFLKFDGGGLSTAGQAAPGSVRTLATASMIPRNPVRGLVVALLATDLT
jgi:hypothetical protein